MANKTYQLRGYCTPKGYQKLEQALQQCCTLYNSSLAERKDAWEINKHSISKYDQYKKFTELRANNLQWKELSIQIGRSPIIRLDSAFNNFFKRVAKNKKLKEQGLPLIPPGYPRFKAWTRYKTLEVPADPGMFKVSEDDKKAWVRIKGLPRIELKIKRELLPIEQLKTIGIKLHPYRGLTISLSYEVLDNPLPSSNNSVGIDLGINTRLQLSDGNSYPQRIKDRTKEKQLQRSIARSKKGSPARRKKGRKLANLKRKETIKNRNECHRITSEIIKNYDKIAIENLTIPNMVRSAKGSIEKPGIGVRAKKSLNRSIHDQTWGLILQQLRYKAESAGRELVAVNPRYTSQTCSKCGERNKHKLKEYRTFVCESCSFTLDRDLNAARNIRYRAFGSDPNPGDCVVLESKGRVGYSGELAHGELSYPLETQSISG